MSDRERLSDLLAEHKERTVFNRIQSFEPYPFQRTFMYSSLDNAQVLLMAANQVGKTLTGAICTSYHLTGLYPDDWEGKRFDGPINAWAAGVSNESTKDLLQTELFGPPDDVLMRGSGTVPRHCIGEITRKPQVPNAMQSVLVQHYAPDGIPDGWSRVTFKAFEMGQDKFMGAKVHWIWLDEQPPEAIFTQCATRTVNTGGIVAMTFTPEDGMTPVVYKFLNEIKPGQTLIQATWDDAPHIDEERREQLLAIYSPHEREMRSKGIPVFGSGMVFPVAADVLSIEPFEMPSYWPALAGIDFGWEHPTAAVWLRWDQEADIVYVVDCYRQDKTVVTMHAAAINARPRCNVAWPHDGYVHEKGSGVAISELYRSNGVMMLPTHFTNPMAVGEKGVGNFKVEPGISAMLERMEQGRFKVFSTCFEWFEEFEAYHREKGIIYALKEDIMSATRYAHQMLRFAEPPESGSFSSGYNRPLKRPELGLLA